MDTQTAQHAEPACAHGTTESGAGESVDHYRHVRRCTESLCEPLATEDYVVQSMPDVSPTRWHLAHTSWFFEMVVLRRFHKDYRVFEPAFGYLFNSYYNTIGPQFPRPRRGVLSRPTVEEVYRYREYVDRHMLDLLGRAGGGDELNRVVTVGLHHEQQHQELILSDIKHVFASNPLRPVYQPATPHRVKESCPMQWIPVPEGVHWVGHDGSSFAFDNETPRHRIFLEPVQIASRLVTNEEFLIFIDERGYDRPEFWLSDGWQARCANGWTAPLYWEKRDADWWIMTLSGMRKLDPTEPVCHVSYYEADAYARWKGVSLPTEAAWEVAARAVPLQGHFVESRVFHPLAATPGSSDAGPTQLFGDVWEWTSTPYGPYPGYQPPEGALGEYNAKFMANQMVLRGGSCATPSDHIRRTYRNFFPPDARWLFNGFRLARDAPRS